MKMFRSILSQQSGSQEDNQASIFGCPLLDFGCRGRLNFATLFSIQRKENLKKLIFLTALQTVILKMLIKNLSYIKILRWPTMT